MNQPKAPAVAARAVPPERPEPPRPVVLAVRMMYAGAAVTAIGMVLTVVAVVTGVKTLRAHHPHATVAQLHATQNVLITVAVVSGLLKIGAWLLMARANRGGLKWARWIATALFALETWNLIARIGSSGTATNLVYTAVSWLAGAGAVFFLWQRESSAYFS